MKRNLFALIAGCTLAASAIAMTDSPPSQPPRFAAPDSPPSQPPRVAVPDSPPSQPPRFIGS